MNPLEKLAARILHRIDSSYFSREKEELLEYVNAEYQKYIAAGYDGEAAVAEIIKASGGMDKLCKTFVKKYNYHPLVEFWMVTLHGSMVIGFFIFFAYFTLVVLKLLIELWIADQMNENLLAALACGTMFFIPYTAGALVYGRSFKYSDHPMAKTILALLFVSISEKAIFSPIYSWSGVSLLPFFTLLKETSISAVPWFVRSYFIILLFSVAFCSAFFRAGSLRGADN